MPTVQRASAAWRGSSLCSLTGGGDQQWREADRSDETGVRAPYSKSSVWKEVKA